MPEPTKRTYDSSRRKDQARLTRARIVDAASALFVDRGYAATSIAAIAERAGVAPQTVYGAFGTKAALLVEAIGVAMAGDDEPVALYDRPGFQAALAAPDPAAAAAAIARLTRLVLDRAAGIFHAAETATADDPEIAALWVGGQRARLTDMRRLARDLRRSGHLRADLTPDEAADLLYALGSPQTYRLFTVARAWAPAKYERWLRDSILRTVLTAG
jgi:AcrR family transcriptional regulator